MDLSCKDCHFNSSKIIGAGQTGRLSWCWRFDIETDDIGYCNSKYFVSKNDSQTTFDALNPKIAGYFERKK